MLTLKGKLLKTYDTTFTIKNGPRKGEQMTVRTLQILANGGDRVSMLNVTDMECREWPKGDCEVPVYVKPYIRNSGKAGYSFNVPKEI